jgi:hypothetical protein
VRILIILGFLSLTGCSTFFGIANFSSETSVLQKPIYTDTTTSANYLSGTFCNSLVNSDKPYRNIQLATVDFHNAVTQKNVFYAIGGFAHYGNYEAIDFPRLTGGNKRFFGGGVTAEFGAVIRNEDVEWRALGIKGTFITELGAYANFRNSAAEMSNQPQNVFNPFPSIENLNPNNIGINISLTSEMIYKRKDYNFGIASSVGVGHQIITIGAKAYLEKENITLFVLSSVSLFQGNYVGSGVSLNIKKAKMK